ncbi:MAG: 3-deoxy-D-manno-octulosonic acid transferase [Desulfovibrionaceae bacterium]
MTTPLSLKLLRPLYDAAMSAAIPLLKSNHRLEDGFDERTLSEALPAGVDVWIQGASAGEAHLAINLLEQLGEFRRVRALVTTCTRQGRDILDAAAARIGGDGRGVSLISAYLPFDKPALMRRAVAHVRPKAMVLLETELWPGLLWALRQENTPAMVVNGRMRTRSLSRYLAARSLFEALAPAEILAVSEAEARRFRTLFRRSNVSIMHNMKFERFALTESIPYIKNPLSQVFRPKAPLLVLGSMREEEKLQTVEIIRRVREERPRTICAVFPRHMHHVENFAQAFHEHGLPCELRSQVQGFASPGSVLLWDAFGELNLAYWLAKAVFVGGSLAPLGGQNFLEPLACGVIPVMGPHWFNFSWVGEEILEQGLALQAQDAAQASELLLKQMANSASWENVRKQAFSYVAARQGGARQAAERVARRLGSV